MSLSTEERSEIASVLALIASRAGSIHGRVRLQKTMYLLRRLGLRPAQSLWFEYYHYGPYSDELTGILQQAVQASILDEKRDYGEEWQRYEYFPSEVADRYSSSLESDVSDLVDRVLDSTKNRHWRTLELAATIDYLRQVENLDACSARARALALKPACANYEEDAQSLLGELALG